MRIFLQTLFFLCLSLPALAQELPERLTPFVSDYAGLLTPEQNAEITAQLQTLRRKDNIAMNVVIMNNRAAYGSDASLEAFATRLFDTWGIGDASRNEGILFLVLLEDRETRIELGKSYAHSWDGTAARVLDRDVLPHFKNGEYARGISAGTAEIIATIALPHKAGSEAPTSKHDWVGFLIMTLMFSVFGFIFVPLLFGKRLRDGYTRLSRCPNCRKRGLHTQRKTKRKPTRHKRGEKRRTVSCGYCDFSETQSWSTSFSSSSSSSSGSSSGGGSSGGGGASGSW
ncbi:TPM domain-containing protein [Lentibacter algarum]|uniref:TPM domain-containing protein n=1 Tax=Lentibacter algarum TaxID=576131 RepID=UPI001C096768|nr:TPM domain-containing protein [Lentibacter algarum]MBU2982651.1 TPM domain-containing protein [Lentibacter algarum]